MEVMIYIYDIWGQ